MHLAGRAMAIATSARTALAPPAPGKAEKAARDFEAVMLEMLLEPLEKSFAASLGEGSPGSGDYGSMGTQALATALAARGGIGIARLVLSHLPPGSSAAKPEPNMTKVPTTECPAVCRTG